MMVTPGTVLGLLLLLSTPPPEHVQVSCGTPMQNDQTLCIYGMFSPLLGSDECHGSSHIGNTALHVAALRCRRGLLVQVVCVGFVQCQPTVPDIALLLFFVTALWMLLMLGRYPGLFPDLFPRLHELARVGSVCNRRVNASRSVPCRAVLAWPATSCRASPVRMCRVNACRAVTRPRMLSTPDKTAWPEHETLCLISIWGEDSIQAQIASSLDCSIAREKNSRAAWFRSMIVACAREYATLACEEVTPTFWLALSEHRVNGGWPSSFDTGWLGSVRRRARVNGV